jgi:uncharacterized protein (TIGR00661 family)
VRVLYGVTGEGLGHTMRARVLLGHLVASGHEVRIVASGRAAEILRQHHPDVVPIRGLSLIYERGGLQRLRTLGALIRGARGALNENARTALAALDGFRPRLVITDFDSFSYTLGRLLQTPIISVDHQHVLSRCQHPVDVLRGRVSYDFSLARAVVGQKLPKCDRYLVTTFFFPPLRDDCAATTRLLGPLIRAATERIAPRDGGHVLVYQTGAGHPGLMSSLEALSEFRFRVYGVKGGTARPHVEHRPFSEAGFLDDLSSASAVIANGGYSTLSEAVCLGKPVLSVPIRHQGEQELNAAWLEHEGLGASMRWFPSPQRVRRALLSLLDRPRRAPIPSATKQVCEALDRAMKELS